MLLRQLQRPGVGVPREKPGIVERTSAGNPVPNRPGTLDARHCAQGHPPATGEDECAVRRGDTTL